MMEVRDLWLKSRLSLDQGPNWGLILIWGPGLRLGLELSFSLSVFWLRIVAEVSCSIVEVEDGAAWAGMTGGFRNRVGPEVLARQKVHPGNRVGFGQPCVLVYPGNGNWLVLKLELY